ncbi:MAG TPA: cell division protein FtsZ [Solirubrobacterales bacterium]|nr:cell division protein FtsZ [Solirubrobacterales bacterium]
MARRNKRASMREGPLSDLFRSTSDDAPVDPPEAPRYGRDDPAEAKKAQDESPRAAGPVSDATSSPTGEDPASSPPAADAPAAEGQEGDVPLRQDEAPTFFDQDDEGAERGIETSSESAPERLKRVFNEEPLPRRDQFQPEKPKYGRDEPAYEPPGSGEPHQPVIKVVGVGGAGVNAVNRMVDARIPGIEFMAVNTDLQSLQLCVADVTVHIGDEQTRGLGAGADPDVGHRSAFEEQDKIKRLLKGSDMVFVAAGAGGGTGSGAAPVVARLAREVGALTVGIVTKPFSFEGSRRGNQADKGIEELAAEVDTLIVVPNDRLLEVLDQQTSMVEAFKVADDVLRQGVQGISDLVTLPAVINLDFADVRTIMADAGRALLGIGMAYGDERAVLAAEKAISSPLLETSMEGARSILLSITGGADLSLVEVSEAAKVVGEAAHPDANIIFGANVDEELSDQIWVTVVATRFDGRPQPQRRSAEPTIRRTKEADTGRGGRGSDRELGIDVPEFLPG